MKILQVNYLEIDWTGGIGFRDKIAHHYFDVDAQQVLRMWAQKVGPLPATVKKMKGELR